MPASCGVPFTKSGKGFETAHFKGNLPGVTCSDFDHFLRLGLCWLDGVPTVASHAGQRQCPHCRRKWCYEALRRQWRVAQEFCKGSSRKLAATEAGVDVHTAGRHYRMFHTALAVHFTGRMCHPDGGVDADPNALARCCKEALRTTNPRKRLVLMVDLCLQDMPVEMQLDLLYRLVFRKRLRELSGRALAARYAGSSARTDRPAL